MTPNCTIDPYKHLGLTISPDGSITRSPDPVFSAVPDHLRRAAAALQTKDITLNPSTKTWARIYLPDPSLLNSQSSKFPLILWFRGSGFILYSVATSFIHDSCVSLALQVNALVVSVEYRRSPEHRLPAAYDDAVEAIHWVKNSGDEWLTEFADFDKFFIGGTSAGGNIAYHAAIRTVDQSPLMIRGLILHQPFFGGVQRSESELRLADDRFLPLSCNDLMWQLALPVGADRDHEYCNPTVRIDGLTKIGGVGWRLFVDYGDLDPLMDRQIEFVKLLEEIGMKVVSYNVEGGTHGFEVTQPIKCKELYEAYKYFMSSEIDN